MGNAILYCLKIISWWNNFKNRPTIFLSTSLPRYWWHHNLQSSKKLFFQRCLNYKSLGFFLCTDQFLTEHYGFKMQGKWDIASDIKCYNVISREKFFSSEHSYIIYHSKGLSSLIIFWEAMQKRNTLVVLIFASINVRAFRGFCDSETSTKTQFIFC